MKENILSAQILSDADDSDDIVSVTVLWKEGGEYFMGSIPGDDNCAFFPELNIDNITGVNIPKGQVHPTWVDGITVFQGSNTTDVYTKSPYRRLLAINVNKPSGLQDIKNNIFNEITVLETLSKNPHPNVVKYYGCLRNEDNLIEGICLRKYRCSLSSAIVGIRANPEDW